MDQCARGRAELEANRSFNGGLRMENDIARFRAVVRVCGIRFLDHVRKTSKLAVPRHAKKGPFFSPASQGIRGCLDNRGPGKAFRIAQHTLVDPNAI